MFTWKCVPLAPEDADIITNEFQIDNRHSIMNFIISLFTYFCYPSCIYEPVFCVSSCLYPFCQRLPDFVASLFPLWLSIWKAQSNITCKGSSTLMLLPSQLPDLPVAAAAAAAKCFCVWQRLRQQEHLGALDRKMAMQRGKLSGVPWI